MAIISIGMEKYLNVLSNSDLFKGIENKDILSILPCIGAFMRTYKKGEFVFESGRKIDCIAVLLEGSLYIQSDDYWGNRSILRHIPEGEIFGEAYAFSGGIGMLNDVVAIDDCVVLFLNANKILSTCASACDFHTRLVQNLFFVISQKNTQLVEKLGFVTKRSTREKLIAYLSHESKKQNSANIVIPFNRQQLADFLSVDRSAMSNELCKMRDEGLLTFRKNNFKLL